MFRRFSLFIVLLLIGCVAKSQTEPQFTQHMYHQYLFNPAYAGSKDAVEFSLLHRSQYVGLADRIIATQAFNFNMPIYAASSGVGLTIINDFIGLQRSTYININYDYRKSFKWGKMAIGIGGGIIQTSLDGAGLRAPDGNYDNGEVNHQDEVLPNTLQQGIAPDFSVGVFFNNSSYYAGVAVNHVVLSKASIQNGSKAKKLVFSRDLFFTGGYNFFVSKKLSVMPSAIIKTDLKEVQSDVSLNLSIIDYMLTGVSVRGYTKKTVDALAIFIGARYKGFQLVYSYDANLSYLAKFNAGSHEISLSYAYPLKKKTARGYFYYNPRYN